MKTLKRLTLILAVGMGMLAATPSVTKADGSCWWECMWAFDGEGNVYCEPILVCSP